MKLPGCNKAWEEFLNEHPGCHSPWEMQEKSEAGMAGYTQAPYLAWSGWRYRIPGGPQGGQYHGFIAPDDTVDGRGWPFGHEETFRPIDNPAGLGTYPWQQWDTHWGGIPLKEGETVSDYVYRGPAEMRPRPNASGGANTVRAVQTQRSAGYAIAPGNYKGIGGLGLPMMPAHGTLMRPITPQNGQAQIFYPPPSLGPICPAWGCGVPPIRFMGPPTPAPSPAPVVTQPPPPVQPGPAPTVNVGPAGSSGCPSGQYRDAAGNCTSDYHNPYVLYLPDSTPSGPAPTVAANTCPTGYTVDANGNCVAPTSGMDIGGWLQASTQIAGMNVPNLALAGVAALVAMHMFRGGRR